MPRLNTPQLETEALVLSAPSAGASRPQPAPRAARRADRTVMRVLDVVLASVALIVAAPLLLVIAIAVRLDSPGQAMFRQERLGRDRRPFVLLKFRTMRADAADAVHRAYIAALLADDESQAAAADGALYKLAGDPRVTGVGRVLRRTSLDELPQLVNVLRGEMSLVGPRPVIAYEVESYPDSALARFSVNPGLTGLWQVSGRNRRTYQEMLELDVEYARRRSVRLDLSILVRTIPTVLGRRGVA